MNSAAPNAAASVPTPSASAPSASAPSATALLVVDIQESFRRREDWALISAPDIAARAARLVEHARAHGDTVAWILHSEPGSGGNFDPASGLVALLEGLTAAPGDLRITKTSHNAFTTTNLGQQLQRRWITRVRLAGIRTEQCVETTARLASDLGYEVELVLDATATHPLPLLDGTVLPPEQVIERTAAALAHRFARITTLADVLAT